jgi:hypothetical protein
MPSENPEADRVERDVDAIKQKFGPLAEVYAENRREAAGMAGNDAGEQHWKTVAEIAEDDGQ